LKVGSPQRQIAQASTFGAAAIAPAARTMRRNVPVHCTVIAASRAARGTLPGAP